jgi:CBS domain containing-hemolysin-like protein
VLLNQIHFAILGHMVLVSTNPGAQNGAIGVITLEDVIEELIGEEIVDETDVYVDGKRIVRDTWG